jgi:hypothetical protein
LIINSEDLKLKVGTEFYTCQGINNECNYQTSDSLLTVTGLAIASTTTVSIIGAGFTGFSGFTPYFRFVSIMAD